MSDPIFSSLADTQTRQRINGLAAGHSVLEQLDLVIDDARGAFYTRLGLDRLNTIIAYAPADPPTTDEQYLRLIAATTEQKMIRAQMLTWLGFLAKEGEGGRIYQEWNDVPAFRDMSASRREAEIARLNAEIDEAFGILSGTLSAGSVPRTKAAALGSTLDKQYRKVGFSLYASPAYLFHFALDTDTLTD